MIFPISVMAFASYLLILIMLHCLEWNCNNHFCDHLFILSIYEEVEWVRVVVLLLCNSYRRRWYTRLNSKVFITVFHLVLALNKYTTVWFLMVGSDVNIEYYYNIFNPTLSWFVYTFDNSNGKLLKKKNK